jgi:hypothetical protein
MTDAVTAIAATTPPQVCCKYNQGYQYYTLEHKTSATYGIAQFETSKPALGYEDSRQTYGEKIAIEKEAVFIE